MFYHSVTDTYFREGQAFELEGLLFPADWHERISSTELAGFGLTPVESQGQYMDPELYINTEDYVGGQLIVTNTPRDPEAILRQMADKRAELIAKGKAVRVIALDRLMGLSGRAHRAGRTAEWQTADAAAEALLLLFKELPEDLLGTVTTVQQRYATIIANVEAGYPELITAFEGFDL